MPRVWDQFLSERDKLHLQRVKEPPRVGFGNTPALLLIDNWKAALGESRVPLLEAVDDYPLSMGEEAWDALEQTKRLLAVCRARDMPIIHTTMLAEPNSPWEFYTVARLEPKTRVRTWQSNRLNPSGGSDMFEIAPDLAPLENEILIRKLAPSAFWGTPLVGVLQRFAIDTLLVTGESTSGCVRATVVDAAAHCYRAMVVEECVYDRTEASHAMALFDMHQKYGDVVLLEEVLGWLAQGGGPEDGSR